MKPKLNSNVSIIKISNNIIEFFKTNTRSQIRIKVENDIIMKILMELDGEKSIDEISERFNVEKSDLMVLLEYLSNRGILNTIEPKKDFKNYDKFRRVINFLSDYATSHDDLLEMWNNIRNSTVMIIGLGAVGSWVAYNLVQSGVENFILMDPDIIETSNIHRQFSYNESNVGEYKVDVIEERLKNCSKNVYVRKIKRFLDENILYKCNLSDINLIINCADKPNVDLTSLWIGEYAMKYGIPHIIGGGYNLHLSLIGQTIIPGKTACVKCFQKRLEEENTIDSNKVKKLIIKNRKVGSLGPMCSLIASMIGMESIKILTKKISPANINRRGEFDIYTMNITYKSYEKYILCEWCGKNGKYCC